MILGKQYTNVCSGVVAQALGDWAKKQRALHSSPDVYKNKKDFLVAGNETPKCLHSVLQ